MDVAMGRGTGGSEVPSLSKVTRFCLCWRVLFEGGDLCLLLSEVEKLLVWLRKDEFRRWFVYAIGWSMLLLSVLSVVVMIAARGGVSQLMEGKVNNDGKLSVVIRTGCPAVDRRVLGVVNPSFQSSSMARYISSILL